MPKFTKSPTCHCLAAVTNCRNKKPRVCGNKAVWTELDLSSTSALFDSCLCKVHRKKLGSADKWEELLKLRFNIYHRVGETLFVQDKLLPKFRAMLLPKLQNSLDLSLLTELFPKPISNFPNKTLGVVLQQHFLVCEVHPFNFLSWLTPSENSSLDDKMWTWKTKRREVFDRLKSLHEKMCALSAWPLQESLMHPHLLYFDVQSTSIQVESLVFGSVFQNDLLTAEVPFQQLFAEMEKRLLSTIKLEKMLLPLVTALEEEEGSKFIE